jgi:hypothetical protein
MVSPLLWTLMYQFVACPKVNQGGISKSMHHNRLSHLLYQRLKRATPPVAKCLAQHLLLPTTFNLQYYGQNTMGTLGNMGIILDLPLRRRTMYETIQVLSAGLSLHKWTRDRLVCVLSCDIGWAKWALSIGLALCTLRVDRCVHFLCTKNVSGTKMIIFDKCERSGEKRGLWAWGVYQRTICYSPCIVESSFGTTA